MISASMKAQAPIDTSAPRVRFSGLSRMLAVLGTAAPRDDGGREGCGECLEVDAPRARCCAAMVEVEVFAL